MMIYIYTYPYMYRGSIGIMEKKMEATTSLGSIGVL